MPAKHRWLPGGNEQESTSLRSVLACGATCAGVCGIMWCNYVFLGGGTRREAVQLRVLGSALRSRLMCGSSLVLKKHG